MTRQDFRLLTAPISLTAPMSPVAPQQQTRRPVLPRPDWLRRAARLLLVRSV